MTMDGGVPKERKMGLKMMTMTMMKTKREKMELEKGMTRTRTKMVRRCDGFSSMNYSMVGARRVQLRAIFQESSHLS